LALAIASALLILQGFAELIRNIAIVSGHELKGIED
jgi:TRAP-type mannitol/chloroaromatic compound transport system permease small subunit